MAPLLGHFLIASEDLADPNFARSVVLIVQHSPHGAMGVIVNRPTPTTVAEAWLKIAGDPCGIHGVMHLGGPCEGTVSVLHTGKDAADIAVLDDLFFSANKESVERVIENPPRECRFFIGYAGWGPGQLEGELSRGDWRVLPARVDLAFGEQRKLWESLGKRSAARSVLQAMNIPHVPDDPSVN